ncbi:hypothetical protein SAMN05216483_6690 [Streptomyces sp. 2131.1]|uniref:hypothetical protein n=1 Tax=Streptomyces sp. 2131.1 TaxID=1855346 RepID=UPI000895AA80|nr:hypothetical protein [Streptomyces sp. 2131.1]SEE83002.1 hypothetical protein SAMN05216483_6690 [Streptomyces sp. 2131.1]
MAVTLDKTPQLHLFIAVVTDAGTDRAAVHHLGVTTDSGYDNQVARAWAVKDAVPGSAVHLVVARDRSAGFREALNGDSADFLINPFFMTDSAVTA